MARITNMMMAMNKTQSSEKSNENATSPRVVVILPAKNEAATIKACIEIARQSKYKPAIIVADGYSTDKTREIASESGAEVIMSGKRLHPGKGAAMKSGLQAAFAKEPGVILFLDADLKNLTTDWLDKLIDPVIDGRYDMARASYLRAPRDAGVTKLVAKPLLYVFFPEIAHFDQPLTGEVAAKTDVWKALLESAPPDGWGVDVWFLIETAMRGFRIIEVFLGTKDHASFSSYSDDLSKLSKMGEQVAIAIIGEAIRYERIDNVKATSP
jgi:glycosyltransferase involved in cell wall biosynthesis